jgi:hypothetical protein
VAWRGEFFGGGFDLDRVRIGGAEYNRWVITSLALIVPETACGPRRLVVVAGLSKRVTVGAAARARHGEPYTSSMFESSRDCFNFKLDLLC